MRFQACTIVRQFLRVQTIYETALLTNWIPKSSFEGKQCFNLALIVLGDKEIRVVFFNKIAFK